MVARLVAEFSSIAIAAGWYPRRAPVSLLGRCQISLFSRTRLPYLPIERLSNLVQPPQLLLQTPFWLPDLELWLEPRARPQTRGAASVYLCIVYTIPWRALSEEDDWAAIQASTDTEALNSQVAAEACACFRMDGGSVRTSGSKTRVVKVISLWGPVCSSSCLGPPACLSFVWGAM